MCLTPFPPPKHGIIRWFGLEGTLQTISFQPPATDRTPANYPGGVQGCCPGLQLPPGKARALLEMPGRSPEELRHGPTLAYPKLLGWLPWRSLELPKAWCLLLSGWALGKMSSLEEWSGLGPGCPGQWGSLHPWRGSKTLWMWHLGTWFSRHEGVGVMVGLDDLRGLFQP